MDFYQQVTDFLMFELGSISDYVEDERARAVAIIETIAATGGYISESVLQLYLVGVPVRFDILEEEVAFAKGLGILNVTCDCSFKDTTHCFAGRISQGPLFDHGVEAKGTELGDARVLGVDTLRKLLYTEE